MPPPRPRSFGNNTGISAGRPSSGAPMSERQQMALLLQMTSSCVQDGQHAPLQSNSYLAKSREKDSNVHAIKADQDGPKKFEPATTNILDFSDTSQNCRSTQAFKKNELKKKEDILLGNSEADTFNKGQKEILDLKNSLIPINGTDKQIEATSYSDFEQTKAVAALNNSSNDQLNSSCFNVATSVQVKNTFSDADQVNGDYEDLKKRKKKDFDNNKDFVKCNNRVPSRHDKIFKLVTSKNTAESSKVNLLAECKSPDLSPLHIASSESIANETEEDEIRIIDNTFSGAPKVPPLKIVIPQQTGDNDNVARNGKLNLTRNHSALPYVVSSNSSEETEKCNSNCNSPTENLLKATIVLFTDEKSSKLSNEDKGIQRVLRSSLRSGGSNADRSSNNSSPQMHSKSPSPATGHCEGLDQVKVSSSLSPNSQQSFETDLTNNVSSSLTSSIVLIKDIHSVPADLHPRKRKIKAKDDVAAKSHLNLDAYPTSGYTHPHDYPYTNCYHMYLRMKKQIQRKHLSLYPTKPRPPQGFNDYLLNRRSYLLLSKNSERKKFAYPCNLPLKMRDIFQIQENDRNDIKSRHVVEKEKLGLCVEQEILRVHAKAARSVTYQLLPFSACTAFKDTETYNMITPEQEEKDRNARSRFNGRLLLSWLQDVDDKWEKLKEAMILRHHNESESLNAVQRMDWEAALKEYELCDQKTQPTIDSSHVPIVHVNEDFDLIHV